MRQLCLILAFVLIGPRVLWAESIWTKVALGAYATAQVMDATTTMAAIEAGRGHEGNPLARPLLSSPLLLGAVKGGVTALTSWQLFAISKRHPRFVQIVAWSAAGFYTAVAIHNSRVR